MTKTSRDDQLVTLPAIRQNAVLAALTEPSAAKILEHGVVVRVALRQKIYEAEQQINDVFFPLDCVLSIVARMRDGSQIEVGTIGREGTSAFPLLMGASSTANVCYCQVRGSAIKIPADLFRQLAAADPAFRQLLDRYLQAYVNMLGQLAACNRLHTIYERCARWLLMTRDRMDFDAIPLTQEFLAMMLGTGQSGVAIAAGTLQHAGLIKYTRGMITILDRPGLEDASCECYAIARSQFGGLLRAVPGAKAKTAKTKTVRAKTTMKTFGAKYLRTVEVGTVGHEGFVESEAALGSSLSSRTSFCQVQGLVARMSIERFVMRMDGSLSFARFMRSNVRAALFSSQQFTVCNAMHSVLERCARWIAMTADRVGRPQFKLTHEFLAIMLGVRRASVTEAADQLHQMGAIEYSRGVVTFVDGVILERIVCECYKASKETFSASLLC